MKPLSNQGQSTIEAATAGLLSLVAFSVILMLLYRGLVYFTARHCINELIFCAASLTPEVDCKKRFHQQTKAFLIFKEESEMNLHKTKNSIIVTFKIEARGTPNLSLTRSLRLPLEDNIKGKKYL